MDMPLLAALLTFLGVILASSAAFFFINSKQAVQMWRRRADGSSSAGSADAPEGAIEQAKAQLHALLEWFAKLNQPANVEEAKATRRLLVNAGYRSRKAPVFYVGTKLFLATAFVFLLTLIPAKAMGFPTVMNLMFLYLLAATCGYYAPSLWLKLAISSRQDALNRAMPDALDLMVVCVEAGLGLDQAIARVGDEVKRAHPELHDELNILTLELRTGVTRQEALRNLAHRTNLEEVRNLVAILVQTDRFGTSIGQALRVHSDSMRTTRRLKAEEMAAKLPVKLLFPLIFFIFPSLFIVTVGPAIIRMVRVLFPALHGH